MKRKWPLDVGDMFVFASLAFIFYGMHMVNPAYAYLSVGAILLALGLAMVFSGSRRGEDK